MIVADLDLDALDTIRESLPSLANRRPMHKLIEKVREAGATVVKGAALTLAMKTQADLGDAVELAIR